METQSTKLLPRPPFDLHLTATYQTSYLREHGVDSYQDDVYTRVVSHSHGALLTKTSAVGPTDHPELRVEVAGEHVSSEASQDAAALVGRVLGIEADITGFYGLASQDPHLAPLCQRLYGLHGPRSRSIFEALVTAIAGQQVAVAAARAVLAALVERYGTPITWDGVTYQAFPSVEALAAAGMRGLRQCKFSARKAEYIWEVARSVQEGRLDLEDLGRLSAEEFEAQITSLRGVGHWTANWLLIRALGHPDGFPAGDLALARTVSRLYGRDNTISPKELEEFSQRWVPYRGYVTLYLSAASRMGLLKNAAVGPTPPRSKRGP